MEADKVLLREQALRTLRDACTEENFWNCIVAFQGYPFLTSSGLPFTYTLKMGRRGAYTKELFIDRREHSKSLSWSSVRLAFHEACKREDRFFTYTLKMGRRGAYTKELFIDRREHSKSLSWSSVRLAFHEACKREDRFFSRPKEIADVRGISYSYSLLGYFGVIQVPEEVKKKWM